MCVPFGTVHLAAVAVERLKFYAQQAQERLVC